MNRLIAFFKRLFGKVVKEEPVAFTPPVSPPVNLTQDANFLAWQAYQEELKRTGKFPTTEAAPRTNVIPEVMLETPLGNTAQARLDAMKGFKPDLKPEELQATATKKDNSTLPEPPYFVFVGDKPEMQTFNELVKSESQQAAYKYLMRVKWNVLGSDFREQASKYFDAALISRIINTYSGGGGKYFKS